jgi:hypothetical protein
MYVVAAILVVLAGLFYAAGNHAIVTLGVEMYRYRGTFCDHPFYVVVAASLAAVWARSSARNFPPTGTLRLNRALGPV